MSHPPFCFDSPSRVNLDTKLRCSTLFSILPKIVFSTTLKKADWQNAEVVKELTNEEMLKLKQQPGKNMMIFGSGTIVEQLTKLGLIDEYQLMVNPVVLGKGEPLFKNITDKINLKLANTKTFKSGIVLLQYQPVKQ